MPISDDQLDGVVEAWNEYVEQRPNGIKPYEVLKNRDMNMYRGFGITGPDNLVKRLIDDRSIATLETAMGYLYERVLEELGLQKVSKEEKKKPGYQGIDFIQLAGTELRVINLKSGLTTSNGDITAATKRNLKDAKDYWEQNPGVDDNPMRRAQRTVKMLKAVARGKPRSVTTDGVVLLVGDKMWEYFGAGAGLLKRLNSAMGRNPMNHRRYQIRKTKAGKKVREYLDKHRLVRADGQLDWEAIADKYLSPQP